MKDPFSKCNVRNSLSYAASHEFPRSSERGIHFAISGRTIFSTPLTKSTLTHRPRIGGGGVLRYLCRPMSHITASVAPPTVLPLLFPPRKSLPFAPLEWNRSCFSIGRYP